MEVEDLLSCSTLELIYNLQSSPTYIHYNGSNSTHGLFCLSSDISMYTKRSGIDDPGSRHRQVVASINLPRFREHVRDCFSSWNFKKVDWKRYEELIEE
ncbi:hypothetical protein CEXT_243221 [Caerostris extrusa]|uniref:Uncharacterized protein n=1 Tax=Caerostris extrusa TaxID=172846 RepID=A0AAV4T168_CAEEX|nr:hypothetical protein CEXT_243221 [Caerostris extrusa]